MDRRSTPPRTATTVDTDRRSLQIRPTRSAFRVQTLGISSTEQVNARDEAEAFMAAQQALKLGVFEDVVGEAWDNKRENPRVFVCGPDNPDESLSELKKGSLRES